jgi:hypothetical protein
VTPAQAARWATDIDKYLPEIYNHGCYVIGGQHTSLAVRSAVQSGNLDIPPSWLKWRTKFICLPTSLLDYQQELDVIGEFDNEPIALEPTFKDHMLKLRDRWEREFNGSHEQWLRFKKAHAVEYGKWMREMVLNLGGRIKYATIGQMLQACAATPRVWKLYKRLLDGDYLQPDPRDSSRKIQATPIESISRVLNIFPFGQERQEQMLRALCKGELTWQWVKDDAKKACARLRCRNSAVYFLRKHGFKHPNKPGEPIDWDSFATDTFAREMVEDQYWSHFLNENYITTLPTEQQFEKTVLQLYQNKLNQKEAQASLKAEVGDWLNPAVQVNAKICRLFRTSSSKILALNCKTEDAHKYLQKLVIGNFLFLFLCFFVSLF